LVTHKKPRPGWVVPAEQPTETRDQGGWASTTPLPFDPRSWQKNATWPEASLTEASLDSAGLCQASPTSPSATRAAILGMLLKPTLLLLFFSAASALPHDPPPAACNTTKWHQLCPPTPTNVQACMSCCSAHKAELIQMHCDGPDVWPDYCENKYVDCRYDEGFDYDGDDLKGSTAKTKEECCADCKSTTGCRAWTLWEGGPSCYLKKDAKGRVASAGHVSGVVAGPSPTPAPPPSPPTIRSTTDCAMRSFFIE
jgi:hypothetical protein